MVIIATIIISIIVSVSGCYLFFRPKLRQVKTINHEVEQANIEMTARARELYDLIIERTAEEKQKEQHILDLEKSEAIKREQLIAETQTAYQQSLQQISDSLDRSLESESERYQNTIKHFQDELQTVQKDGAQECAKILTEQNLKIQQQQKILDNLQMNVDTAVAAAKRQEEINNSNLFYRIQLQDWEIQEIITLREISPKLKNVEPLNKIIWKCYYEKPTTDLIGRVIGSGTHTGIYKITNIINQKCYVGQAVNLADRWKQHIKRGVGADTPTRNKLYPAMLEAGAENFTFEVIEECDRSLLDAREDYWQDYFKAKEFGYSIK